MVIINKIIRLLNKKYIGYYNSVYLLYLRTFNRNKNFTIISNNCWGGGVYEDLKLKYLTPTVGLYFYAEDYIKFVKNLQYYLRLSLNFTEVSRYEEANINRKERSYPIGILNDIEIHFLHYENNNDALQKWNRRKKRINFNNLFVKFDDRDGADINMAYDFDKIENVRNKVFFSAKKIPGIKSLVYLKKYKVDGMVGDLYTYREVYRRHFDVMRWLNV